MNDAVDERFQDAHGHASPTAFLVMLSRVARFGRGELPYHVKDTLAATSTFPFTLPPFGGRSIPARLSKEARPPREGRDS